MRALAIQGLGLDLNLKAGEDHKQFETFCLADYYKQRRLEMQQQSSSSSCDVKYVSAASGGYDAAFDGLSAFDGTL